MQVGDIVEVCRVYKWQARTECKTPLGRARIVRETKARWVLDDAACGNHYDKKTLSLVPRYLDYDHFIRPAEKTEQRP